MHAMAGNLTRAMMWEVLEHPRVVGEQVSNVKGARKGVPDQPRNPPTREIPFIPGEKGQLPSTQPGCILAP